MNSLILFFFILTIFQLLIRLVKPCISFFIESTNNIGQIKSQHRDYKDILI